MRRKSWKIKIFRGIRGFVLSPIPKSESSEITEILRNNLNAKIKKCNFKEQLRCSSNHINVSMIQPVPKVLHICFPRASNPSRFIKLSSLLFFSFSTQKVEVMIKKQIQMYLNFVDPKIKILRDFRVFVLSPIPKTKNLKSRKFIKNPKILKYENIISKTLQILFKWHYSQNDSATMFVNHVPYFFFRRFWQFQIC